MAIKTVHVKVCDKCGTDADTRVYRLGFHKKNRSMDLCQACAGPMVELLAIKMPMAPMPPRQLTMTDMDREPAEVG